MTTKAILALALLLGLSACSNPETPAGHEGYVYHVPLMFGKMEYRGTLKGPSSTGMSWRLYVDNIDVRAKSYLEKFELLTVDNLSVSFEVTTRIELKPGSVKQLVEDWGGDKWYELNVKEPLRTVVRRAVVKVSATQIQLETDKVGAAIFDDLQKLYNDTPIMVLSVDIGHIEFPAEVTAAIQQKIAKEQELERQEFVLAKTRKEAAIRVLEALKVAKQQRIISSTLDPLYVQRRAVEVYKHLSSSNKTIIVLPNTPDGTALPLVTSQTRQKQVTPEENKLLADMETRYMKIAGEHSPEPPAPTPTPAAPAPATPAPATP